MLKVVKNILQREIKYHNTVVLTYYIEYPQIVSNHMTKGIKRFNVYNRQLGLELKNKSENELYNQAVETYQYNQENGYPNMVYEVYRTYEITLNMDHCISLYTDEYTYTGGAHGMTIRKSQTWGLPLGRMIALYELYPNNPYFLLNILNQINRQISQEPEIYFEQACCLTVDAFNPDNFYLTSNELVIYFQQYDIAPYSSGIREFLIKK